MNTMMIFVLLMSICHEMKPTIAEEVNSLPHIMSERATKNNCKSLYRCMETIPELVKSCKVCGMRAHILDKWIISGNIVDPPNKYPWMVSIMQSGKHICGGSIISNRYILTAAHCLEDNRDLEIGFLSNTSRVTPGYPIERTIIHPKYKNDGKLRFDFGLIKLKKKITCDKYKNPVCLPPAHTRLPQDTHLKILGWGRYSMDKDDASEKLLHGDVFITKVEDCLRTTKDIYCVRGESYQSACSGDSGGPLNYYNRDHKHFVMGVASFVLDNCSPDDAFGYASIERGLDWIIQVTGVKPEKL